MNKLMIAIREEEGKRVRWEGDGIHLKWCEGRARSRCGKRS